VTPGPKIIPGDKGQRNHEVHAGVVPMAHRPPGKSGSGKVMDQRKRGEEVLQDPDHSCQAENYAETSPEEIGLPETCPLSKQISEGGENERQPALEPDPGLDGPAKRKERPAQIS